MDTPPARLLSEARSLALHRAIAARLRADPTLVEAARQRVRAWQRGEETAAHPAWADAWAEWLALPLDELIDRMCGADPAATDMRAVTPFAGVVDARERWAIWRRTRAEFESREPL